MLTRDDLLNLVSPHRRPCLTLLLPTHRHVPETAQDPIRFRNLLKAARGLLSEGTPPEIVDEILSPVEALDEPGFWRHQLDGLAIYSAQGYFARYSLPMPVPELAVAADSFHIRPVVSFLQANRRYFVLVLGQKNVGLYEGTSYGLGPVEVEGLPTSLEEALGTPERDPGLQVHASGDSPVYHGHGGPGEDRKEEIGRFFRAVDRSLWQTLREERAPLVLAGPAPWLPLYREISRYSNIVDSGATGSLDDASPEAVHALAWPVARAVFEEEERRALAAYDHLAGSPLATDILTEVAKAAMHGRVRRLFVQEGRLLFGSVERDTGTVVLHGHQEGPTDDDVLDDIAEAVLARGGEVLEVAAERMPQGAAAAAILRW